MIRLKIIWQAAVLSFFLINDLNAETIKITQDEQDQWIRNVIPLPHEICISGKIVVKPEDVSLHIVEGAGEIEIKAAEMLYSFFCEKTGKTPSGNKFYLVLGIVDKDGQLNGIKIEEFGRLKTLPNSNQAYLIKPHGDNTLLLAANDGKGVYYAAVTLKQLIEPHISTEKVVIPLAEILDWPDLEERGLWNFPALETWITWMTSMKLNYGKMVTTKLQSIERDKPARAIIDRELLMKARMMGFNYLPFIMHLNFLMTGICW